MPDSLEQGEISGQRCIVLHRAYSKSYIQVSLLSINQNQSGYHCGICPQSRNDRASPLPQSANCECFLHITLLLASPVVNSSRILLSRSDTHSSKEFSHVHDQLIRRIPSRSPRSTIVSLHPRHSLKRARPHRRTASLKIALVANTSEHADTQRCPTVSRVP